MDSLNPKDTANIILLTKSGLLNMNDFVDTILKVYSSRQSNRYYKSGSLAESINHHIANQFHSRYNKTSSIKRAQYLKLRQNIKSEFKESNPKLTKNQLKKLADLLLVKDRSFGQEQEKLLSENP